MNAPGLSSIWNAPGSQPLSRTASAATNGYGTPPRQFNSPSLSSSNVTSQLKFLNGPTSAWNMGGGPGLPLEPISRPQSSNVAADSVTTDDLNFVRDELWRRYRIQQSLRQDESELMLDLLHRFDQLQSRSSPFANNTNAIRKLEQQAAADKEALTERLKRAQERLDRAERLLASNPYVLVLIDGDELLFADELVSQGEQGGEKAATQLHEHIKQYISQNLAHLCQNYNIKLCVYSNLSGLAESYHRGGVVDHPSKVADFTKALTRAKTRFDWIDVGPDHSDQKIKDSTLSHLLDSRCRQIFVGCSAYKGKTLETLLEQGSAAHDLVTMIKTTCAQPDNDMITYRTTTLNGLFHAQNISLLNTLKPPTRYLSPPVSGTSSEAPISRASSASDLREAVEAKPVPSIVKTSKNPVPFSWASTVKQQASLPESNRTDQSETLSKPDAIPRNRKGQRVDPTIKHDKDEVERVKKMKLCNVHFLRHECPYGDECTHVHRARPGPSDLKYLALVARMAPCMHGSACEDAKCIYGHICPAPEGRRGELCIFGDQCRFAQELHKIDRVVVKTRKV